MAAQTYTSIKQTVAIALTQQMGLDLTTYAATFEAQFPIGVSWAEDRIYQTVPMLASRQSIMIPNATTAGSRYISLASLSPIPSIVEEVYLASAVGGFVTDDLGHIITDDLGNPIQMDGGGVSTLTPFEPASLDFLLRYWPAGSASVAPTAANYGRYAAMQDPITIAIAPTPDAIYPAQIVAIVVPEGLSSGNSPTYLSQQYPDALISGTLVYLTGALTRNFGAQADEPRQAVSWQTQFDGWLAVIRDEERRRRGLAPDFPQPPQAEMRRQAQ